MLLLALMVLPMSAQRPIKYQVKRGETLSSIARKFGMSENELKSINDDLSYCYAGMMILVRDKRGVSRDDDYDDYVWIRSMPSLPPKTTITDHLSKESKDKTANTPWITPKKSDWVPNLMSWKSS